MLVFIRNRAPPHSHPDLNLPAQLSRDQGYSGSLIQTTPPPDIGSGMEQKFSLRAGAPDRPGVVQNRNALMATEMAADRTSTPSKLSGVTGKRQE